jgi:hypothetical protein
VLTKSHARSSLSHGGTCLQAAQDDDSEEELTIDPTEVVEHLFLIHFNLPPFAEANISPGTPHLPKNPVHSRVKQSPREANRVFKT